MGKGSSPKVTQAAQQEVYPAATSETVTPAIAKSIAQDTEGAQQQQLMARQRMRGIASTYLRGNVSGSGKQKLGQ